MMFEAVILPILNVNESFKSHFLNLRYVSLKKITPKQGNFSRPNVLTSILPQVLARA